MENPTEEKEKAVVSGDPKSLYHDELVFIDKPFYFPGTNGRAVLLVHGWTTTPYELRRLGKYLHAKGYTVSAPLLTGHGTVPADLENVSWEAWNKDVERAYFELKEKHKKIYVVGTSLGASLASILAGSNSEISGLVLMAMPYRLQSEKLLFLFARIILPFKKYYKKYYPPSFGSSAMVTRKISYQTYPIKSVLEILKLAKFSRRVIGKVTQPCFMLQSSADHIVAKKSLEKIFEKVSSKVKQKKYLKDAYHTFISDIKNENVFEEIFDFLDKN
ncbi:MAG: alpha/beta fold hydrolase [Candidatus Moranbacteria bacterium]|nr:alpha/beta fold hydrolase [Candidatus Moranbacteria bacterium]